MSRKRRVSVEQHMRWRHSYVAPDRDDDIDVEPIIDRPPAQRGKREANRVLRILDEIDQEGQRRG